MRLFSWSLLKPAAPTIRATPLPVQLLLRKLPEAMSAPDLLDAFRDCGRMISGAALDYAAATIARVTAN